MITAGLRGGGWGATLARDQEKQQMEILISSYFSPRFALPQRCSFAKVRFLHCKSSVERGGDDARGMAAAPRAG